MNNPTSAPLECDIPVYGTWSHRPSPDLSAEWEGHINTPDRVAIRPNEYYGFAFGAVAAVSDADVGRVADAVRGISTFQSLDLSGCDRVTAKGFCNVPPAVRVRSRRRFDRGANGLPFVQRPSGAVLIASAIGSALPDGWPQYRLF